MYRTKRHVPSPSNSLWSVVFIFSVCTVTNRQQVCFSFVRGCAFCCLSVSVAVVVLLLRRKFFSPFVSESPCERCGRFGDVPSVKPEVRTPCSSGCRLPLVKQKTNRRQLSFSSAIPSYEQNLTAFSVCLLFFFARVLRVIAPYNTRGQVRARLRHSDFVFTPRPRPWCERLLRRATAIVRPHRLNRRTSGSFFFFLSAAGVA